MHRIVIQIRSVESANVGTTNLCATRVGEQMWRILETIEKFPQPLLVIVLGTKRLYTKVVASDMEEANKVTVRILFDSGSQRSYITELLKHQLKLVAVKREKLHLNTFGNGCFKSPQCEVVRVKLIKPSMNESVVIDALSFPTICTPLPPMIKVDPYPCLRELKLADDGCDKPRAINVLIGSNYYWSVVTGEVM